ncbi:MAG: hypothetical protein JWN34_3 [Bryobacterales bacterium]|nr:hypothetical protein [Bryobacterales bacterium]
MGILDRLVAVRTLVCGVLMAGMALGQTPRAFEVGTVKIHAGPRFNLGLTTSGTRLHIGAQSFAALVMWAYDVPVQRISVAPGVASDEVEYDVDAKAEGQAVPTRAEFRQMLQAFLADRFQLRLRREFRESAVYALLLANGGPKFPVSASDAEKRSNHGVRGINQTFDLAKATMDDICREMGTYFFIDLPVVDKTGLIGAYDIRFEATPNGRVGQNLGPEEVSVFSALKEQLGLRLEPQKAPVEFLVIEHFEKPTGN